MKIFLILISLFSIDILSTPETDLFNSVKTNNLLGIQKSITAGASIDSRNEWNSTPLMLAVQFGSVELIKELLKFKANPNLLNYKNESALKIAFKKNNLEIAELLLKNGSNPNEEDVLGNSLLFEKEKFFDPLPFYKLLIQYGLNPNKQNSEGETALISRRNEKEIFDFLIQTGANLNVQNLEGNTLLHLAVINSEYKLIEELVSLGKINEIKNRIGRTALDLSILKDDEKSFNLILPLVSNFNSKDQYGMNSLMHAINNKNIYFVEELLKKNINLEEVDNNGYTAFLHAILVNDKPILDLLLSSKVNLKIKTYKGYNALMLASYKGNIELLQKLVPLISTEEYTEKYETALYHCIRNQQSIQYDALNFILTQKKSKNIINTDMGILGSVHFNDSKSLEFYIQNNYDLNIKDKNGNSALHIAAEKGYTNIISQLISKKIDLKSKNNNSETAFQIAIRTKNFKIAELLDPNYKSILPTIVSKSTSKKNRGKTELEDKELVSIFQKDDINSLKSKLNSNPSLLNLRFGTKGKTLLMLSISEASYLCFKHLLNLHNSIEIEDEDGNTAIFYILEYFKLHFKNQLAPLQILMLENLLIKKANINHINDRGESFIHLTVYFNLVQVVKILEEYHVDWNLKNSKGQTPLHLAASQLNLDLVKFFIKKKLNVNEKDNENKTPIWNALESKENPYFVIKYLLRKKAILENKSPTETIQDLAKKNGHKKILLSIFKIQSNSKSENNQITFTNDSKWSENIDRRDERGMTELHKATLSNSTQKVIDLLNKFADPNISNDENITPLFLATELSNFQIVKSLLDKGANTNYADTDGFTPLMSATFNGNLEIVKLLLSKGAIVSQKNKFGDTALMIAARYGHLHLVKELISNSAHPNIQNKNLGTALIAATLAHEYKIVKYLLENSSNPNLRFADGYTALHIAVKNKRMRLTKLLLNYKSKINSKNLESETILLSSILNEDKKIFKILLENDPDILSQKETYIYEIIMKKSPALLKMFLEKTNISAKEIDEMRFYSYTPLMLTTLLGDIESTEYLLNLGVDAELKNNYGQKAIDFAIELNRTKITQILKR
jgi:ankyrin repeat protein